MAEKETQTPAPMLPLENASAPVDAAIEKPEEAFTKSRSVGSDTTSLEQKSPIDDEQPTAPAAGPPGPPEQEFPPFKEQVIVMIAILLAIFLIALVSPRVTLECFIH